ncbi:MAG: hypothetical protein BWZ10_02785 [candidate division BRC1 bacterium ADurb.BinA364]|nr:MAG: hypothetical protein BWZ10_02785 [candidate division BRC1 bacterium ADurb.BinA364]
MGRFHAYWSRSRLAPPEGCENEWRCFGEFANLLTDKFNHPIVDAVGRGHFVGVNYYVDSPSPIWYGEGDDMFFIDGEPWPPSLHGTGTEDYFNSSWCPKEVYIHPYFGYPRVNNQTGHLGRTHCYRFHIEDPIVFHESLRGSIERGHADCLASDTVTVAYWYQTLPHKPFPALPDRAGRLNMPPIDVRHIHAWREAWRQLLGGGALWGNEPLPEDFLARIRATAAKAKAELAPDPARQVAEIELRKQTEMLDRRKPNSAQ